MKNKIIDIINEILFIVFVLVYLFTLEKYGMGDSNSRIRYLILTICIIVAIISWLIKNEMKIKFKKIKKKELLDTILVGIVFLIYSIVIAKKTSYGFNMRTFTQISLFMFPSVYIFGLINVLDFKQIFMLMKITLLFLIIVYFFGDSHHIQDFFELQNWKKINLRKSLSFTESSICAESFLQLFLYFYYIYVCNKNKNKNGNQYYENATFYMIISFIFTILSFKRLGMVFAIIILVFGKIVIEHKNLHKFIPLILAIVFTILTYYYTEFMKGEIFTNIDVYKFTTGRDYILSLWKRYNYISFGYGSSMILIGRYLEMDLVQIYLELNLISLFLFSYVFFRIAGRKTYPVMIMIYEMLNMLTASSLPYSLSWILLLIAVVSPYLEEDKEDSKINCLNIEKEREISEKSIYNINENK